MSISKFFDDPMLLELAKQDVVLNYPCRLRLCCLYCPGQAQVSRAGSHSASPPSPFLKPNELIFQKEVGIGMRKSPAFLQIKI